MRCASYQPGCCFADEILLGGQRGGGKTDGGILWLLSGNLDLPAGHPVYETAINYRNYTALVVRRHAQDNRDWVNHAAEIYCNIGAKLSGNPPCFVWPKTGARIYTDHLNDEEAFSKYKGWNLSRILIEELTEIPYLKWYLRLFGSLRRRKEDGKISIAPQMLATTNPDGPGHSWTKKRFIDVYSNGGKALQWDGPTQSFQLRKFGAGRVPPNTLMIDPVSKMGRIFIPAALEDNKFIDTQEYEKTLKMQAADSEAIFQAWRYGRWDVFAGQFYPELRFEGPMPGEAPEANHSYDKADVFLAPWWPVAIGIDWGFNHESATYWGKFNQEDKRLYVAEEYVVRQMGSRQLGQEVAKRTLPYLRELGEAAHIPLFLSHDAFSKEDATRTRAELFAMGIEDVLGAGSAHLAELTESEKKMKPEEAADSLERRYMALSSGACITIHKARQDRGAMATYLREQFNWKQAETKEPDIQFARSLLTSPRGDGHVLYEEYMERFRAQKAEALPKIKIERKCTRLRECITSLVYDPDNTEVPKKVDSTPEGEPGDDPYDGFCHLVMGARFVANRKPRNVFVLERIQRLKDQHGPNVDPALVGQVLESANEAWNAQAQAQGWLSIDRLM